MYTLSKFETAACLYLTTSSATMSSASVRCIDHHVRYKPPGNRYEDNTDVGKGVDGGSGASVTDAAVALSQLPVLGNFRVSLGLVFAIFIIS